MIWNRKTEAEARVGPGRPAAQKAIDKTTAGFAGWSATKRGAGMKLAATKKAKTAVLCRRIFFFCLYHNPTAGTPAGTPARSRRPSENYLFYYPFRLDDEREVEPKIARVSVPLGAPTNKRHFFVSVKSLGCGTTSSASQETIVRLLDLDLLNELCLATSFD
jgi:hypothetical protein